MQMPPDLIDVRTFSFARFIVLSLFCANERPLVPGGDFLNASMRDVCAFTCAPHVADKTSNGHMEE
jgi:hypothetical protein